MKTLTNEEFLEILHKCCSDGRIDDEKFNLILSSYWPYELIFKRSWDNE